MCTQVYIFKIICRTFFCKNQKQIFMCLTDVRSTRLRKSLINAPILIALPSSLLISPVTHCIYISPCISQSLKTNFLRSTKLSRKYFEEALEAYWLWTWKKNCEKKTKLKVTRTNENYRHSKYSQYFVDCTFIHFLSVA